MSVQQQIWDYIRSKDFITKEEITNFLNLDSKAVVSYISALNKHNYLIFCSTGKRALFKDTFKLLKNTGEKAPLYNYNVLKDFNIKKELQVGKKIRVSQNFNSQTNFKDILDCFLEYDKEEVILKDISKMFISKRKDLETIFGNSFLTRWIKKLEEIGAITQTGNSYRNSKIYLVDIVKIKQLREELDSIRDYNLVLFY
ncbi:hypothetical protein [Aliarcobacter butzleri]|uniref:hypothetical protein n=1 Tax=Aliarcobacter butzleri TaxID=28197 RepID=UPI00125ED610|nr:hypothetical protein [Aliarcobacter butzleri]